MSKIFSCVMILGLMVFSQAKANVYAIEFHRINAAMAINQAVSAIPVIVGADKIFAVGVGVGHIEYRSAIGAAFDTRVSNVVFRVQGGVSDNADTYALGAGVSFEF